jgi:hypothetical protein
MKRHDFDDFDNFYNSNEFNELRSELVREGKSLEKILEKFSSEYVHLYGD